MTALHGFDDRWRRACAALAARDAVLGGFVARYAGERLEPHGDVFRALARAVVGQQISAPAAERIWARVLGRIGEAAPRTVEDVGEDALRDCGLTRRKAEYLVSLARRFAAAPMVAADWSRQSDDEAGATLRGFRGVGPWTAGMAMIFALGRLDVLPETDIGLQRAAAGLYGAPRSAEGLAALAEAWRPWRTVAAWHLWRDLDPAPVAY